VNQNLGCITWVGVLPLPLPTLLADLLPFLINLTNGVFLQSLFTTRPHTASHGGTTGLPHTRKHQLHRNPRTSCTDASSTKEKLGVISQDSQDGDHHHQSVKNTHHHDHDPHTQRDLDTQQADQQNHPCQTSTHGGHLIDHS
jgi:hypothetical protein